MEMPLKVNAQGGCLSTTVELATDTRRRARGSAASTNNKPHCRNTVNNGVCSGQPTSGREMHRVENSVPSSGRQAAYYYSYIFLILLDKKGICDPGHGCSQGWCLVAQFTKDNSFMQPIGQAYYDVQAHNQQLLQQVTEASRFLVNKIDHLLYITVALLTLNSWIPPN